MGREERQGKEGGREGEGEEKVKSCPPRSVLKVGAYDEQVQHLGM